MSVTTKTDLRHVMIYQVYVRNYSEEGTFKALQDDLERICDLGTDILYLLPIHPIGEIQRKGKLGSPYSIQDYYKINAELGTLEDFKALIDATHKAGMKIMMDIVFNHTSYDSVLLKEHPEFFYKNHADDFSNRVGDWWDITDLDYTKDAKLWTYLIDNLVYWTQLGVDGFRFDVASFLPLAFLEQAHDAVLEVNPESLWLSESVHGAFLKTFRDQGFEALSECEIYQVFDMAYDYDTHDAFLKYLRKEGPLKAYVDWVMLQEQIYPKNYIKMRNLENHDFGRIAGLLNHDLTLIKQWYAFAFFNKGATMVYAGGEFTDSKHPDLFNKDTIVKTGTNISELIRLCQDIVSDPIFSSGIYTLEKAEDKDVIVGKYTNAEKTMLGVFNVNHESGKVKVNALDGTYSNLITGNNVTIKNGLLLVSEDPIIIEID